MPVYKSTAWKHLIDQCRLVIAERLIIFAFKLAPVGHPDSKAIVEASFHVFFRKPNPVNWRERAE